MSEGTGASGAEEREVFGTRLGFVLAAVGSALGLGNTWRFPLAILAGWVMRAPEEEQRLGASPLFLRVVPLAVFLLRYVAPVLVGPIAWISLRGSLAALFGG